MFIIVKELILVFAELLYLLKFYRKSADLYNYVYKKGSNVKECLEHMISSYANLKEADLVIKYCDEYLKIDQSNFNIFYFKAQALIIKGFFNEALDYFDLALNIIPNDINCLLSKSGIFIILGEDDLFLEHNDKILKLDSSNPLNYYLRSFFYFKKEEWDLALKFIDKSLYFDKNNEKALDLKRKILNNLNHV